MTQQIVKLFEIQEIFSNAKNKIRFIFHIISEVKKTQEVMRKYFIENLRIINLVSITEILQIGLKDKL